MEENKEKQKPIDLSSPKSDQSTYIGRAKHFFKAANPLNDFATSAELQSAKDIVEQHKKVHIINLLISYNLGNLLVTKNCNRFS